MEVERGAPPDRAAAAEVRAVAADRAVEPARVVV